MSAEQAAEVIQLLQSIKSGVTLLVAVAYFIGTLYVLEWMRK